MDKVKEYDNSFELLVLDHNGYEYGYLGKKRKFIRIYRDIEWNDIEDYKIIKTKPFTNEKFTEFDYLQADIEFIKAQKEVSDANVIFLESQLKEKDEFISWVREFGLEEADKLDRIRHPFKNMFENCHPLTSIPKLDTTTDRINKEIQRLRENSNQQEDKGEE